MTMHMTLHIKQDGEWVYVPDALTPDWSQYPTAQKCLYWKGKLKDVVKHDNVLVQCVSPAVKEKFDNPVAESNMSVVQPLPTVEEMYSDIETGAVIGLVIAFVGIAVVALSFLSNRKNSGKWD